MDDVFTMEAVVSILHSIAGHISLPSELKSNCGFTLPGAVSNTKSNLEFEIAALIARVQHLEAKVIAAEIQVLPDTPSELGRPSAFFDSRTRSHSNENPTSEQPVGQPRTFSGSEERPQKDIVVVEGTLDILQEHVDGQPQYLGSQQSVLSVVDDQLCRQQQLQDQRLRLTEAAHSSKLEQELKKHQQANKAFQKALREIGEIITAVARGDLSKKLEIRPTEMDPEITAFKMVHLPSRVLFSHAN